MRSSGSLKSLLLVSVLVLMVACRAREASPKPSITNGTVTFQVHHTEKGLDRPVKVCLVAAKPNEQPLQNGGDAGDLDGCKEFAAGTRAAEVVGYYAGLLARHGWTAGVDFVASGNAMHFYGISQLAGGSADEQLGVNGATDSEAVPYRNVLPASR